MAYIRPCNSCGQRISMREMPHGQWVAFDASTETPHKCGRKTKPDPDIERLAKKTRKEQEEEEAIVLKRYGIKIENGEPVSIDSDTNADKINSKIEEATSTNTFVTESAKVLDEKKYTKLTQHFSCQNENDILAEFFFLISNFYSSQSRFDYSNIYLNISNYLNPNFKFNLALLADNYFKKEQYFKTKEVLKNFDKKNEVYYWYKLKKNSQIIYKKKLRFNHLTLLYIFQVYMN